MRIAIDARFINPENRGLSTYTRNLIFGLEKIDRKNLYYILLRQKDCATLGQTRGQAQTLFRNPNFKIIPAEAHWYGIKEQFLIPKILYKLKPDLTHFPHFNVPLIYNRPYITTIHDLILFAYPTKKATTLGPLQYAIKNWAYRLTINHALKKSRAIIAVSQGTAQDILRFFTNMDKDRIITIYEGAGEEKQESEIKKYKSIPSKKRQEWLQKKLSLKFPYIFYIGGAYPHKNLERLIFAFNSARKKYYDATNKNLHLVIAGGEDYFFNRLKNLTRENRIKNVILPGFISDPKTFEFIYQEALFCIFPSLYEGFGLPPLEALKREKLTLCHNGTCFPEILGDSVAYFDGKSVTDMSDKITDALENLPSLKKEYLPRAKQILRKYSWTKMARETLELYEKVAGGKTLNNG
jgi:glycosyltransferase involved in cell wall biosynthesis